MDADALRDAITEEVKDYRRPKLLTSLSPSYILQPVTNTGGNDSRDNTNCQPATHSIVINTSGQSESTACSELNSTCAVSDGSLPDTEVRLIKVPGISTTTTKGEVDGNSVEMPSATTCQPTEQPPDDVTMLSARCVSDDDIQSKEEICHHTSDNNGDRTNTNIANDNRTDSDATLTDSAADVVVKDGRFVSNSLVVNTDPPLAVDAKARIKAALLNSGRRRQRLRE